MQLDRSNLPAFARGCAILGAGGGGDADVGLLMALQAVDDHGPVDVVDLEALAPEGLVMPCGGIGAPTVSIEKLERGDEGDRLRAALEEIRGMPVVALMASEIGGSNGVMPIVWAARMGLPLVDADGMGRAFPEVPMVTMELAGVPASPCVLTDALGNVVTFRAVDGAWLERLERAVTIAFGGSAAGTDYTMTVAEARGAAIRGSVSRALAVGMAFEDAHDDDPIDGVLRAVDGARLFDGKVVDVDRRTTGGFAVGTATIDGLGADRGGSLRLAFQNEHLVASVDDRVLACVPDIITVLDRVTGDVISTERLRYGQRVSVIGVPCDPVWRSERGLAMVGPSVFGYDVAYRPVEELASERRALG